MDKDVYFHKTVTFKAWKHSLQYNTSQELFSSHDIDIGTRFLLRTIVEAAYPPPKSILDIGCGYGPLGLTLKSLYPESAVHLTDRDALAVEYSRRNAALNGMTGVETYGSLGFDDVTASNFDLIVSNIPGKAGETVIACLLQEARYYLAPSGIAAVVVVSPLEETVSKILAKTPGVEIVLKRNRPGHAVFHYRFSGDNPSPKPGTSALERGIYNRKKVTIKYARVAYPVQTAYGLPEFDSLSYTTEMLVSALFAVQNRSFDKAVVFNPGQGHVPVALWKLLHPRTISLVDRDLLALRYSRLNLTLNDCLPERIVISHQVGIDVSSEEKPGLIAGVLPEENKEAHLLFIDRVAAQLSPGGLVILSGGSTAITRLVTYVESRGSLNIKSRERRRGYSSLVLEKLDSARKKR